MSATYCAMSCCGWSRECDPECPLCQWARLDHANGEHQSPDDYCPLCRAEQKEQAL